MSKRDKSETGVLVYGGIPRANLMPPEVGMRRRESARRRSLIALSALVVVAVVAGVVASFLYAAAAEQRLADERRITDQLLQTQLEFTEVTQVRADLQTILDLRTQLASVEVLWADALAPYLEALGDDVEVSAVSVLSDQPAQPPLGVTGPLRQPRVATVNLTVTTPRTPEPWIWFREWEKVSTFADASIGRVTLNDVDGYDVVLTINLNAEALSQRFSSPDLDEEGSGTDEEGDQ